MQDIADRQYTGLIHHELSGRAKEPLRIEYRMHIMRCRAYTWSLELSIVAVKES
jgi:hypothetical protein